MRRRAARVFPSLRDVDFLSELVYKLFCFEETKIFSQARFVGESGRLTRAVRALPFTGRCGARSRPPYRIYPCRASSASIILSNQHPPPEVVAALRPIIIIRSNRPLVDSGRILWPVP